MKGISYIISVGRYGGFYFRRGYSVRICLGWVALTLIPDDIDNVFKAYQDQAARDAVEITNLKRENEILTNAAQLGLSSAAVRINETVESIRQPQREESCHNPD